MTQSAAPTPGPGPSSPPLSVVMPVHNALPHLDQAVESILDQTFADFEFVILDDASTDGSTERLQHWAEKDPRIRLLHVDTNLGPVQSSNMVARAAKAPLVARMDADDISVPERLAEQVQLLKDHPEVGVVASLSDIIDKSGQKVRGPEPWRLARPSVFVPFAHGTMAYRRSLFDEIGGYRDECEYWEDQDLVIRMAKVTRIAVIPKSLYRVRQSTTSTRVVCDQERLERALDRVYRATDRLQQRQDYDELLSETERSSRKLDPRVFIAAGSVRLWAGGRPRLFRRLLRQAYLSFDVRSLSAIVWTAWASLSPASLRAFMRLLLKGRNRFAGQQISTSTPLEWRVLDCARPIERVKAQS